MRRVLTWTARHKAATAVLVVLGVGLVGSLVPDETADPASASTTQESGAADRGTTTAAGGPGRGPDPQVRDEDQRPGRHGHGGRGVEDWRNDDLGPVAGPRPSPRPRPRPGPKPGPPMFLVTRVVDGDTIELGNGETVRLAGIDTPEAGECGYETAANELADLVLGRRVRLAMSDEDRDSYGRLLRYVDVGPTDAGLQLIRNGRAIAAYDSRDGYGFHPREPVYVAHDRGSTNLCARMATGTSPSPTPPRAVSPPSEPRPRVRGVGNGGGGCASGYSPCLPVLADLDCADVGGPVKVTGPDPYRLDADGDGVGCDS